MAKGAQEYLSFNRGLISRLGLARVDLKRTALSAEEQTNWIPRVLGSMMLRPGWEFIRTLETQAKMIPFVFASDDTAIVAVRNGDVTITIDDVRLQREETGQAVTNGDFATDLTGWTQPDAGSVNAWQTGGYAGLAGDGTNIASLQQQVNATVGVEHALRIVVERGPVMLRVGSTANGTDLINDYELGTGWHSVAFTPTTSSSFYIRFFNRNDRLALIDSCSVESGGVVYLTAPWATADLSMLRWGQSGDIIFVACDGKRQHMIMRRAARSWSVQEYLTDDGPFRLENTTSTTITASGLTGNITLTSSAVSGTGVFRDGHVGALFRITSVGQTVTDAFSSANDFSSHIRVIGTGEFRRFAITITGTFVATVTLQRSFDEGASWSDVGDYTVPTSSTPAADGLDDQIVWYRIGIKTGNYTSGTATCTLLYNSGSITGVARITAVASTLSASAEVLTALGGTTATEVWAEGDWSDVRGWPSSVAFHDGRLFWAGKDRFWGSVTDQFYTFDSEFEGDAGPISRSIGYGPVDTISWLVSLNRLIAGTDGSEVSCRSSSFNEPLTPTNFTPKDSSNQGSARVGAVKIDNKAVFVQRNGRSIYELAYDVAGEDYMPEELTKLVPDIGSPGVVALAVQRKPDTRVHAVLSDGTVAVMVYDRLENVVCWTKQETDGQVVDVCVLPGDEEDRVYYEVLRTLPSAVSNYTIEKVALESEARGAAITKLADSFVYAAASSSMITNLSHLEGKQVVAWGGGLDLGTFTVSAGSINLGAAYTNRCAGLPYTATFKSSKLAYIYPGRSSLTLKKKIDHVGLVLADVHAQGLEVGPSFDRMDPLPLMRGYAEVSEDLVSEAYDEQAMVVPGEWSTDARLCLRATAPRPCTVLAAVVEMETNR